MALQLTVSDGAGGCCECDQTEGCNCGPVIPCGLACRYKDGTAELCGFAEFTSPTLPPKKYRRYTMLGELCKQTWLDVPCTAPSGDPLEYSGSGATASEPNWGGVTGSGSANPVGINPSTGDVTYRCVALALAPNPPHIGPWSAPLATRIVARAADGSVAPNLPNIGDEFDLSRHVSKNPWTFFVQVLWHLGGWIGAEDTEVEIDLTTAIASTITDRWNYDSQYHRDTCVPTVSDLSFRMKAVNVCDLTSGVISGIPNLADFAGLTTTTSEPTEIIVAPNELCVGSGPWSKAQDPIHPSIGRVETLSDEDTELDAIARANAEIEDWVGASGPEFCLGVPTFIAPRGALDFEFGYRAVQTRATVGNTTGFPLTIGAVYEVRIRFFRRPHGVGGVYVFFAAEIITFTAEAFIEVTDWVDVPNERGWETIAGNCTARFIAPP